MTVEQQGNDVPYKVEYRILELRREVWARKMGYGNSRSLVCGSLTGDEERTVATLQFQGQVRKIAHEGKR